MAGFTVTIEGIDGLTEMLEEEKEKIRRGIQKGLSEAGEKVVAEAKAECPVDTGNLKRSINKKVASTSCVVGTNVEYAPYVEFGTYKMAAKAFLIPALVNKEDEVVAIIREAIGNA